MLEENMEITLPANPFRHLVPSSMPSEGLEGDGTDSSALDEETSETRNEDCTPMMRKYEIEIATSS